MSLLWCDGFDHYGTEDNGRAAMLDGPYAEISPFNTEPRTTNPRTGTHSMYIPGDNNRFFRRVFPSDRTTIGFAYATYLSNLPQNNGEFVLVAFRTDGAEWQTTLMLTTTGRIEARRGDNTGTVLATSDSVVTADAYTHFECRVACDDTNGAVEVRINGVTVLNISGVDTQAAATNAMAEAWVGNWGGSPNADRYIDDMFCWDTNGSQNNDFIGDRRVLTLFPDQDTAEADWAVEDGASPPGSGYEAINDETPDDDTSYIYTDQVGDVSEFGLQDTPEGISAISAIVAVNRMRKDDAGDCNVQCSLVSQGSPIAEANGADRPITEVYTYWQDVFELDPSTAAPWTPESFDAALLKFERTS